MQKEQGLPEAPHHVAPGKEISRRAFLKGALATAGAVGLFMSGVPLSPGERRSVEAAGLPPSATSVEFNPQVIADKTNYLKVQASNMGGVEAFGYRTSNAWKGADGFWYMSFQGGILQQNEGTSQMAIWNTLDAMHDSGFDAALDNGSLGVTIPAKEDFDDQANGDIQKAWDARLEHFQVPQDVAAFATRLRSKAEIGTFVSHGKNYGPYTVWRTQRVAVQKWTDGPNKGLIQRILAGDAAKAAGFVPKEAQLAAPDTSVEEQPSSPEAADSLPFPKEIGELATDDIEIHNMGTHAGVAINDPSGWDEIVNLAHQLKDYGADQVGDRARSNGFIFYWYDDPKQIPRPPQELLEQSQVYQELGEHFFDDPFPLIGGETVSSADRLLVYGVGAGERGLSRKRPDGVWEVHRTILREDDPFHVGVGSSVDLETGTFIEKKTFLLSQFGIPDSPQLREYLGRRWATNHPLPPTFKIVQ